MAYVETPSDIEAKEQAVKPFEVALRESLVPVFDDIRLDFENLYNATGQVLDANAYNERINNAISQAQVDVDDEIGGDIVGFMEDNPDDSLSLAIAAIAALAGLSFAEGLLELEEATDESITFVFEQRRTQAVPEIASTTNAKLQSYVDEAVEVLGDVPRPVVANTVGQRFEETIPWRTQLIAEEEVGFSSRAVRNQETEIVLETIEDNPDVAEPLFTKEWVTRGDDLVRPDHVEADGQVRPSAEPFVVGGEQLMYPRDRSLGASNSNVINCRCDSVRSLDAEVF
jgi:hypothetical protein